MGILQQRKISFIFNSIKIFRAKMFKNKKILKTYLKNNVILHII